MGGDVRDPLVLRVVNAVEGAGDGLLLVPARLGHAVKLLRLLFLLLLLLLLLAGLLLDKGQVIPNPVPRLQVERCPRANKSEMRIIMKS